MPNDAVRQWLHARRLSRPRLSLRLPRRLARALLTRHATAPARRTGTVRSGDRIAARPRGPQAATTAATARKRRAVVWFERRFQNPVVRAALRAGVPLPMFALLQTTGRTSGQPRQTPVINGLVGDQFWIVAEHGRHAQYVKNLEADPRIRVKANGTWRTGTAQILDEDDPLARARWMADTLGWLHKADAAVTRVTATTPLTVRLDLNRERT